MPAPDTAARQRRRRVQASPTLLRLRPRTLRFRPFTAACMPVAQPGEGVWRARARELAIGQLKSACLWALRSCSCALNRLSSGMTGGMTDGQRERWSFMAAARCRRSDLHAVR